MTIKEVSKMFGLTEYTLRYYEKQGLIGPVKKMSNGVRNYSQEDLNRIEFIKCMRSAELPIDVLKQYIDLYNQGQSTVDERRRLLENQRDILKNRIRVMQEAYDKLNIKIELYDTGKLDKFLENQRK